MRAFFISSQKVLFPFATLSNGSENVVLAWLSRKVRLGSKKRQLLSKCAQVQLKHVLAVTYEIGLLRYGYILKYKNNKDYKENVLNKMNCRTRRYWKGIYKREIDGYSHIQVAMDFSSSYASFGICRVTSHI